MRCQDFENGSTFRQVKDIHRLCNHDESDVEFELTQATIDFFRRGIGVLRRYFCERCKALRMF